MRRAVCMRERRPFHALWLRGFQCVFVVVPKIVAARCSQSSRKTAGITCCG
uniref:Uncharacterized protein n=1 Tax=Anopheles dirus TaxID=7168 RepID=A0A182NWE0_9DIPT